MAPGRKIDPGRRFDWRRLARAGRSIWPATQRAPIDQFVPMMRAFGYTADADADLLLDVFRMRFRPFANGPLDTIDAGMITDLATRFPVDVNATWA